jgi:hypothetical protein
MGFPVLSCVGITNFQLARDIVVLCQDRCAKAGFLLEIVQVSSKLATDLNFPKSSARMFMASAPEKRMPQTCQQKDIRPWNPTVSTPPALA